ncbi:hypothetical protein ACWC9Q_29845 [Streptomyces sp. NPDC001142]
MARFDYGRGIADFVVAPSDGIWMVAPNTQITFWDTPVDGTQYTDLLDVGGNPVAYVISDEYGQIPRFSGPDNVFGMWADAGGGRRAWLYAHSGGKGAPGDPGAHWYFGDTPPEDAGLAPVAGDIYLNSISGDLFSYDGTTWTLQTNIRGPEGPGGSGAVSSVNGRTGDVVLTTSDVDAIPASSAGAPSGVATLDATGRVPAAQLPTAAVQSVNGQTGTVVLGASDVGALSLTGGTVTGPVTLAATSNAINLRLGEGSPSFGGGNGGVIAMQNATTVPTTSPSGVAVFAEGGRFKARQSNGLTVTMAPAPQNVWTPQALGFQAWTCDPYTVTNPVAKFLTPQRLYVCGINITEPTAVNRVIMFARGYGGVSAARFAAGIYREDGTKVTSTSAPVSLAAAGQGAGNPPQMISSHIGATPISMPSTVTLSPGRYWVTWVLTTGAATDYGFYHVQNEAPVAPANFFFGTPFARAWYLASQTNTPATLNQAAAGVLTDHDVPIMALALV